MHQPFDKQFFDKHAKHLTEEDALDMIKDQLKLACDDLEAAKNHLYHCAMAHEMLTDYFQVKGTRPDLHKVDN